MSQISKTEAAKICRDIAERAEMERAEVREREAKIAQDPELRDLVLNEPLLYAWVHGHMTGIGIIKALAGALRSERSANIKHAETACPGHHNCPFGIGRAEGREREATDRKTILLRAARDLIRRGDEGPYVQSAAETLVFYDGANCDGLCLADDIESELGIDRREPSIPLGPEE